MISMIVINIKYYFTSYLYYMYRTFFPYETNGKYSQFEVEGMRCPQCGEMLDMISNMSREIFLCPNCGYYHETVPSDENIF